MFQITEMAQEKRSEADKRKNKLQRVEEDINMTKIEIAEQVCFLMFDVY